MFCVQAVPDRLEDDVLAGELPLHQGGVRHAPPEDGRVDGERREGIVHCKKGLTIFPSPAGMSLTKLSLAGNFRPGRVWLMTSRLETGKSLTFYYSVT